VWLMGNAWQLLTLLLCSPDSYSTMYAGWPFSDEMSRVSIDHKAGDVFDSTSPKQKNNLGKLHLQESDSIVGPAYIPGCVAAISA